MADSMEHPEQIKLQGAVQTSRRFLWPAVVLTLTLLFVTGAYAFRRSCDVNAVKEASARLIRQRNSYDHSYQFATSASPNAIVRPVAELQQILMYTQDVPVPVCMQTAKEELVNYMRIVIRAFQAYGAQEPEAAVRDLIEQSNTHYNNFNREMDAVHHCAPYCFR